jgi:tetratricopeptide (TPR) repeat protein
MRLGLILIAICLATASTRAESEADRLVYQGIDELKARNLDTAIEKFSQAIEKDPKEWSAYNNRGLAYKDKKEFEKAIADFGQVLRLKPDWSAYYNRGIAYYEKGDRDRAIADANKALELKPKEAPQRADCFLLRAHGYFDKENAEAAMSNLNAALKLDQRRADAYVLRGIVHKVRHEYQKSLEDYERAIGLDPTDARSYDVEAYLLSVCPMPKYRDAKKAITYATKACDLTQWKNAESVETLAAAYAEAGQFDEAIKFQTKAAEISPKAVDEKRLALYQQKQPFRDSNRQDAPPFNVANLQNKVVIKLGQKLAVQFKVNGDQIIDPKIVHVDGQQPDRSPDCLWLDFRQDKRGRVMFLWHSFRGTMSAKCLARLKDYDTYFDTDNIRPIPIKVVSPELWKEPIEELVLFDFKLSDTKRPSTH